MTKVNVMLHNSNLNTELYLKTYYGLTATRSFLNPATLDIRLPSSNRLVQLLLRDKIITVWVQSAGKSKVLFGVYFLLGWNRTITRGGSYLTLYGTGPRDLLRRRIIAQYKGTSATIVADFADDMMKDIVRAAFSDDVLPAPGFGTREIPGLTVEPDVSAGPIIVQDFGWEDIARNGGVLQAITNAAAERGTPVWYQLEPVLVGSSLGFLFRTYTDESLPDRTDRIILTDRRGTLNDGYSDIDYSEEANVAYIGGEGESVRRAITQVGIETRYGMSPYSRSEIFVDRPNATDDALEDLGYEALRSARPIDAIGGTPVNLPGAFGHDWDIGYRVSCIFEHQSSTPIIETVTLTSQDKRTQYELELGYLDNA